MVLRRFLNLAVKPQPASHHLPEGQRVYAIGDVHGRDDLLADLLAQIDADDAARGPAETHILFLGDLVDRGPQSRAVVDRAMAYAARRARVRFLLGNHEEVFLKAVKGDIKATRFLTRIGGRETILSYGITAEEYNRVDFDELTQLLSERVPPEHVAFLSSFESSIALGDYLFVHAGIRPGVPVEAQTGADLRWIRGDFLDCRDDHGCMVIHGHSITEEVDVRRNRIGIDTGAFDSGRLTAIGIEDGERWFLST